LWLLNGRPGADPDVLAAEQREEDAADDELQRRYPNAIFQTRELERRAAEHGVKFAPFAHPHHRAAILDFLDNPHVSLPLTPRHATWVCAVDRDGTQNSSMAHPVNQAQFMITYRFVRSHGLQDDYYTSERAGWTTAQWLEHEHAEREIMKAAAERARTTGRPHIISSTDHRAHRPPSPARAGAASLTLRR
jgi:hypothetical protein